LANGGPHSPGTLLDQQPVAKVGRMRERGIFGQIKAENRKKIRDLARFSNADLAEKARSERGASFATGYQGSARSSAAASVARLRGAIWRSSP